MGGIRRPDVGNHADVPAFEKIPELFKLFAYELGKTLAAQQDMIMFIPYSLKLGDC